MCKDTILLHAHLLYSDVVQKPTVRSSCEASALWKPHCSQRACPTCKNKAGHHSVTSAHVRIQTLYLDLAVFCETTLLDGCNVPLNESTGLLQFT